MRYFILFFIVVFVYSFDFTINTGFGEKSDYYAIHLEDDEKIKCQTNSQENRRLSYTCEVNKELTQNIKDQDLGFVRIYFRKIKQGSFNIIIIPAKKSRLIDVEKPIYNSKEIQAELKASSKHFSILIDDAMRDENYNNTELNFPITFPDVLSPHVGALDLDKNPLSHQANDDIYIYTNIKDSYDRGYYDKVFEDAKEALTMHSDSIFASEFWLYYIRSADKLQESTNDYKESEKYADIIIEMAKEHLRLHGSDINNPEILYLMLKANIVKEISSDAGYILDILMTEHPQSIWTPRAILEYADSLANQRPDDANRLYEDVLYSAQDLDLASKAAFKLAGVAITQDKPDAAREYILKILQANPIFLGRNQQDTLLLADFFKEKGYLDLASSLYKVVFENSKKEDDFYEIALRNLAVTLTLSTEPKKAYEYLLLYQKEYPDNEFSSLIQTSIDRIFFDIENNNTKVLHENYLQLIEKYKNQDIGKKALFEELKLSLKEQNYERILSFKNLIMDANNSESMDILKQSALKIANEANQKSDCKKTIELVKEFSLQNDISHKFRLFTCFMQTSHFDEALALANNNLRQKDIHDRVEWLVNASSALYKLDRFQECIKACDDAIMIASKSKFGDPSKALYYRFYSLIKLKRFNEAISNIKALEELRGMDSSLVEVYNTAAIFAANNNFDSAALSYAKKTIKMQQRLRIKTFSPEIEFIYITALIKNNQIDEALENSLKVSKYNLNPNNKTRVFYQIAELYLKQGNQDLAKKYINECLKISQQTDWKSLCEEQNNLLLKN